MLDISRHAFWQIFSRPLRPLFWRSMGITLASLVGLWFLFHGLLSSWVDVPWGWVSLILSLSAGLGLFVILAYLIGPVSSLVAGFFLDDIAALVEQLDYPQDQPGRPLSLTRGLMMSAGFFGLTLLVNFGALMLWLIPGVNVAIFLVVNGYLLGREYFSLVALRYLHPAEMARLRAQMGGKIFAAGLIIAGFMLIPFLNVMTPLFATCFMVHMVKRRLRDTQKMLQARGLGG